MFQAEKILATTFWTTANESLMVRPLCHVSVLQTNLDSNSDVWCLLHSSHSLKSLPLCTMHVRFNHISPSYSYKASTDEDI